MPVLTEWWLGHSASDAICTVCRTHTPNANRLIRRFAKGTELTRPAYAILRISTDWCSWRDSLNIHRVNTLAFSWVWPHREVENCSPDTGVWICRIWGICEIVEKYYFLKVYRVLEKNNDLIRKFCTIVLKKLIWFAKGRSGRTPFTWKMLELEKSGKIWANDEPICGGHLKEPISWKAFWYTHRYLLAYNHKARHATVNTPCRHFGALSAERSVPKDPHFENNLFVGQERSREAKSLMRN